MFALIDQKYRLLLTEAVTAIDLTTFLIDGKQRNMQKKKMQIHFFCIRTTNIHFTAISNENKSKQCYILYFYQWQVKLLNAYEVRTDVC